MKEFKLKVSPRMLELLSKDLYTNMYFVLAELIANAYDADAENVYVFVDDNEIRVEDDGNGMSEEDLDLNYLLVGGESRTNEDNARTKNKKRLKMGRKGVGKLAALSISNGFKLITIQNGKTIGLFIPNKVERDDEVLRILSSEECILKNNLGKGTAIVMENPKVPIPKLQDTIMKNIAKVFPNDIEDFKIHIIYKGNSKVLIPDEKDVINRLATLIIVGDEKKYLADSLPRDKNIQVKQMDTFSETISMMNNSQQTQDIEVSVSGWIGTYKTTRGMKKEINEFSDNYLAIFAHNKMGQRNILNIVGKNRVYESYIVGNLYIDAFESSDFPDMAGTNRQGYNESDSRWITALKYIREITDNIVKLHLDFANLERAEKESERLNQQEKEEQQLRDALNKAKNDITKNLAKRVKNAESDVEIDEAVSDEFEAMKLALGFKATVDANKKKILISQTLKDKAVSDIIYQLLRFNDVPKEDIIYSNGSDPETNLPEQDIYGYLQKFFVESASAQMIYVLFVTSENVLNINPKNPSASWGALMEIGAAWVTKKEHWIFNIDDFKPEVPLNVVDKLVAIHTLDGIGGEKILSLTEAMANSFCLKIMHTCETCGYRHKSFEQNKNYLINNLVTIYEP